MAGENAVLPAPHVDAVGSYCDVTDYDFVAEMISLRDDMVTFAQSLQGVAIHTTDSLGHDLLFGTPKSFQYLGGEGQDVQARIAAATAQDPIVAVVTLELAAEMTSLLDALG